MRRVGLAAAVVAMVWAGPVTPVLADSAAPTTYRSEVTSIQPPTDRVDVEVVGGDAFIQVTVDPGTEVLVPGYQGEPYVRVTADGEVMVNRNSPSFWISQDRYAQTGVPETASVEAEPAWQQVASGGSYGWHDHRIHWMSPQPPPAVDRSTRSLVQEWSVPMLVDGVETTVTGTLEWLPPTSPLPWALLVVAAAGVSVWSGRGALVAGAAGAAVVGLSQTLTSPLGWGGEVAAWLPPVLALAAGGAAVAVPRHRIRLVAVGGVLLAVWAGLRFSSLWMPVLPTSLPAAFERGLVALVVGTAVASLVWVYRQVARPAV